MCNCDRNATGARPDVQHRRTRWHEPQRLLHHKLRLWPRDQHSRTHLKIKPPELLMPSDVLHRLTRRALFDSPTESLRVDGRDLILAMRKQIRAIATPFQCM